jgi:hypothetical protein
VIPLVLALAAACSLTLAFLLLRGPEYRVGRLLRTARAATIGEAVDAAEAGTEVYVRVHGRISSDEEFPDENDRPLVFRRRRLESAAPRGRWQLHDEERLAVPFGVEERSAFIAVDVEALDDGLVVLPRESIGLAREAGGLLPDDIAPDALVRHRIDQVSAVEHAHVCGVPRVAADGRATMTAGLGRPLILTTLEIPEAIRVLSAGSRPRILGAAAALASSLVLALATAVTAILGVGR